jgi:hypothetical protein
MKTTFTILALLFTLASQVSAQGNCAKALGNMKVGKVAMDCLNVHGNAEFNGTSIKNSLEVTGNLSAKNALLNAVKVTGEIAFIDTIVTGPLSVTGNLSAKDSAFKDAIELKSTTAQFEHSTTQNITITGDAANLNLSDTVVHGDITFTHKNGRLISTRSQVTGKIFGAAP